MLFERDEWRTANRQAVHAKTREGLEELDRGEGILEDELDACLHRLKTRPERSGAMSWRLRRPETS